MLIKAHSFAIFKTCLVDILARPSDQLFALAELVLPHPASREDRHEFVRLRLAAQERARRERAGQAPGLGLVYERFPEANPWGLNPEALFLNELDLAARCARAVPQVLEEIRRLIQRGERVIYVSDSLLPGSALRRMLEAHGFPGEVYCAGDTGKTKASGALFSQVLATETLKPGELRHRGQDPTADAAVPRSLGIAVEPFPQAGLTRRERGLLDLHRDGDLGRSRIVAASRLARLRGPCPPELLPVRILGADVVAPVLAAFVAWSLRDAGENGVERLYFLAREGQILHGLAQVLQPVMGGPVPGYLMGSLAAWVGPSLGVLSRTDLDWLAGEGQSRRPGDLLAKLSLTPEELLRSAGGNMPELLSDQPLDQAGLKRLWELLETGGARRLLALKAAQAKELLLAYLAGQGALAGDFLAVADMGWTLYTQRALRAALAGQGLDVRGWYFGLSGRRLGRMEAGWHRAMFIEMAATHAPSTLEGLLFRHIPVIEQVFTRASHGRVLGYERANGLVQPALGPEPQGLAFTREIQDTVLAYARNLAESGLSDDLAQTQLDVAQETLRLFLARPEKALARAVAGLSLAEAGQNSLVRSMTAMDLARAWLNRWGWPIKPVKAPLWLEGSLAAGQGLAGRVAAWPGIAGLLRAYFRV